MSNERLQGFLTDMMLYALRIRLGNGLTNTQGAQKIMHAAMPVP